MKRIELEIPEYYDKIFFQKRIKYKIDIVIMLLEVVKLIHINSAPSKSVWKIVLIVDKMKRLFFFSQNKFFSINFPFNILTDTNRIYLWDCEIDSKLISDIMRVIRVENFLQTSNNFIESIWDVENEYKDEGFWNVLKELLLIDDWYIRYDYDEERENWDFHPTNHYDIFYSENSQIKLWLRGKIDMNDFIDLLDVSTKCKYLN